MPSEANTLYAQGACYACLGLSLQETLTLAIEREWLLLLDPAADTSVQALLDYGSGFHPYGSLFDVLELSLLDQISQLTDPVVSFVDRAGITDAGQIAAVRALYVSAVQNGWWDKCDLIYPFVGGNATAHAQNLKSSSFTIAWSGTVTHNANGITGDAATGYGNTGYIPSSSGQITLNSVHVGIYRRTESGIARRYYGAFIPAVACAIALQQGAAGVARLIANDDLMDNASGTVLAFIAGVRNDSANKHVFSGAVDTSLARASTAIPSVSLYVLAHNNNGPAAQFTGANLAGMTVGSGITFAQYEAMRDDWQTFNTSLGRQV